MNLTLLLRGLIIGFSIAAPVGPIGVLCIRRTLAEGKTYGFVSGLGAASADGFFGLLAALGLTLISAFLIDQANWLRLIGGAYLCYLGVKTFRSRPAEQAAQARPGHGLLGAYTSTLFLTLTNPLTIFAFAAIFAGLGAEAATGNKFGAILVVLGVFLGSCTWWFILVTFTSLFRSRFNAIGLMWVNRVSGLIILAFGVVVLYGLIAPLFQPSAKAVLFLPAPRVSQDFRSASRSDFAGGAGSVCSPAMPAACPLAAPCSSRCPWRERAVSSLTGVFLWAMLNTAYNDY